MALGFTNLAQTGDLTDGTSYAFSMSRALASDSLGLCAIHSRLVGTSITQPTLSGGGVTWVAIAHYTFKTPSQARALTVFRAMGSSPSGTSLTATTGASETWTTANFIVDEVTDVDTTGTNGSGAIVQSKTGAVDSFVYEQTITLDSSLSATANAAYAVFGNAVGANLAASGGATLLGLTIPGEFNSLASVYEVNDSSVAITSDNDDYTGAIAIEIKKKVMSTISPAGSITPTGTLVKAVSKSLAGSITPTGTLATLIARVVYLGGAITPTGAVGFLTSKLFGGSIAPSGSVTMQRIHNHLRALVAGTLDLIGLSRTTETLTAQSENTLELTAIEEEEA